jgi:methylated-DNA-protein-cysteine methyltransferase-like protein
MDAFSQRIIELIRKIPKGKVATYGRIAAMAGSPRSARQVARILHSCWRTERLPWQRVVNASGRISLGAGDGYELQKSLLEKEGIEFGTNDTIDLKRYLW